MNEQEGIIKYQQFWKEAAPVDWSLISELESWRKKLFDRGYIGAYDDGLGYGNLSIRVDGGFVITGTQTGHLPTLSPNEYTMVTQVDISNNILWCEGPVRASSESLTHAACYALDDTIQAVFHIHDLNMWKVKMNNWPTTPSEITYGTPEMAAAVHDCWKKSHQPIPFKLVMAGHREGVIVAATSIEDAANALLG